MDKEFSCNFLLGNIKIAKFAGSERNTIRIQIDFDAQGNVLKWRIVNSVMINTMTVGEKQELKLYSIQAYFLKNKSKQSKRLTLN